MARIHQQPPSSEDLNFCRAVTADLLVFLWSSGMTPDEQWAWVERARRAAKALDLPTGQAGLAPELGSPGEPDLPTGQAGDEPIDDDAMLSATTLAEKFNVPAEALRKRLEHLRRSDHTCFREMTDRASRDPKYLYRVRNVRSAIDALRGSADSSGDRPPKKNSS